MALQHMDSWVLPLASCAAVGLASLAHAQTFPGLPGAPQPAAPSKHDVRHATVKLISEHTGLIAGQTAVLGIHVTIVPQWHTYWNGRSDSGTPLTAELEAPEGFAIGEWQWPAPHRHVSGGELLDHVYEKSMTILVPLSVPKTAKAGDKVKIAGKAEWLVCNEMCVFEDGPLSIELPVVEATSTPTPSPDAGAIKAARERIATADGASKVKHAWSGDTVKLTVEGAKRVEFYPATDSIDLASALRDAAKDGGALSIKTTPSDDGRRNLKGIVSFITSDGKHAKPVLVDIAPASTESTPQQPNTPASKVPPNAPTNNTPANPKPTTQP